MSKSNSISAVLVLLSACASEPEHVESSSNLYKSTPRQLAPALDCAAITAPQLGVANLTLTSTETVAAVSSNPNGADNYPEHCRLAGKLNERVGVDGKPYAIGFELRLPKAWNQKFFFQGGGGTDGAVMPALGNVGSSFNATNALSQGFAVVSTDAGHASESTPTFLGGVLFGLDPQARIDYGYNAVGTLTKAAKQMISAVYASPVARSYFVGCSNGGRQAMVAAARFADQFDGIVAGDPGFNLPKAAIQHAWDYQQLLTVSPTSAADAFSTAEMAYVGQRIAAKCDALDGASDGIVSDAAACSFELDRDVEACAGGQRTGSCLTQPQKLALAKIMAGPTDSQGKALYSDWPWDSGIGSSTMGGWRGWKLGDPLLGGFSIISTLGASALAYVFTTPPTELARGASSPFFDEQATLRNYLAGFDFDADAATVAQTSGIFSESALSFMTPPDVAQLPHFMAQKTKLLVFHGTADPVFSSNDTRHWYDELSQNVPEIQDRARVFFVPGMAHCAGGPATDSFDMLTTIVEWAEGGPAPDAVLARVNPASSDLPADWSITRTRPLCAYPKHAQLKAAATDLESADSFTCGHDTAPTESPSRQSWVPDPAWTCGMPEGIPEPSAGQFAFDIDFQIADEFDIGLTPLGQRVQRGIGGGTIAGPNLRGQLASRGLEYELRLANDVREIEQLNVLLLGDQRVLMRNCGIAPNADAAARVVLDFEAPSTSAYAFLNSGRYVAERIYDPALKLLRLRVYDVANVPASADKVQITKPAGVPSQSWDCVEGAATGQTEVFSELVTMADVYTVGQSKRGQRNIMMIAGGTLSGMLDGGRVLSGGADYQLAPADGSFQIDARYTIETKDAERIIVRNCGAQGNGLSPRFETRSDGPYAWLNEAKFRSADPMPDLLANPVTVKILFYTTP